MAVIVLVHLTDNAVLMDRVITDVPDAGKVRLSKHSKHAVVDRHLKLAVNLLP